jgi:hypothetical protein
MLKQQTMAGRPKCVQLSVWKRLILIAVMLLPGGSLTMLAPSQTAYADSGGPQNVFICRAGDGGNGGTAINGSNGAAGAPGGDCTNGFKAGSGAPGGDHGSPGGPGGDLIL